MTLADMAQTIAVPDHADLITAPPHPWAGGSLSTSTFVGAGEPEQAPDPAPRRTRRASSSSSPARKGRSSGANANAQQVAKSLAKALGFSSLLLITWLDLEDDYAMTRKEATAIAEPAARILVRHAKDDTAFARLIRRLLAFFSTAGDGYGDEIALLLALYAYGARIYPALAAKQAAAQAQRGGPRGPIPTARPARPARTATGGNGAGSNGNTANGFSPFPAVAPGVSAFPAE